MRFAARKIKKKKNAVIEQKKKQSTSNWEKKKTEDCLYMLCACALLARVCARVRSLYSVESSTHAPRRIQARGGSEHRNGSEATKELPRFGDAYNGHE